MGDADGSPERCSAISAAMAPATNIGAATPIEIGIGGADTRLGWVLALHLACAVAVLAAVVRRLLVRDPDRDARRRAWTS